MKRIYIPILVVLALLFGACEDDFIDLDPQDQITSAVYFQTAEHFEAAANQLYYGLLTWTGDQYAGGSDENKMETGGQYNVYLGHGSDLSALPLATGRGTNLIQETDPFWIRGFYYLRDINILLSNADDYGGEADEISVSVGTAYFFRAYQHFKLLDRFGGVPIVTAVVDVDSPVLYGARNSRYEVMAQILTDLDEAIERLPLAQTIGSQDIGKISSNAAQAFKAKILLYEATWEKYNGTSTDGELTTIPDGYPSVDGMLAESMALSKEVMDDGGYELWNFNSILDGMSSYFLFNLEDAGSNPAGLDKSSNNEYIIQAVFDFNLRRGNRNLSHEAGGRRTPSRKFLDMFLCDDGLPITVSPRFQGYASVTDEFANRDLRLNAYFAFDDEDQVIADGSPVLDGPTAGSSPGIGISGRKFSSYNYGTYRAAEQESFNYPELRLAEVYLNYAEALYELNGTITDAELDASLNRVRQRAGVAGLTNAMVTTNGLNMLEEIRRERAVELYSENSRFFDLRRWGIAEEELRKPVYGPVIEGTVYEGNTTLYKPGLWLNGTESIALADGTTRETLVLDPAANRIFSKKNYLYPIPTAQFQLNPNLIQNPGW